MRTRLFAGLLFRWVFFGFFIGTVSPLTGQCDVGGNTLWGYIKYSIRPGYSLMGDSLDDAAVNSIANTVADALTGDLPAGLSVARLLATNYIESQFDGAGWSDGSIPLAPGCGVRLYNPGTNIFTVTMSGTVLLGPGRHYIPAGRSIRAGYFPESALLSKSMGFPLVPGVKLYTVDNTNNEVLLAESDGQKWLPAEPMLDVGQALIVESPQSFVWDEGRFAGLPGPRHVVRLLPVVTEVVVHEGAPLIIGATATAAVPMRYQWQKDGENIPGATGKTFSLAAAGSGDTGVYWVRASSDDDADWSRLIAVKVIPAEVPILSMVRNSTGDLFLHATAALGGNLIFESSNDFVTWNQFRTEPNVSGSLDIPVETDVPAKFFRASRE